MNVASRPGVLPARRTRLRGMTLLEVMLALTLMAFVLASISMAIDLHLRMLDTRRNDVERVQVARAVLRLIANDLRSVVQPNSTDFSSLASMATSAVAGGSADEALDALPGALEDAGAGDLAADAGLDLSSGTEDGASMATASISAAESPPPVPGLYGNQYELQMDVSRLPRVDEMERLMATSMLGTLQDIPSDVKTISYFLHDPNSPMGTGDFRDAAGNPQAGLVRRALDRSVTLYAASNASVTSLQNAGEIVAPEIAGIQFEYFDGLQWVYEWDSEQMQGLPLAVRITVVMTPKGTQPSDFVAAFSTTAADQLTDAETYTLTVRLPTALPAELTTEEESGMEAVGL